ncbi:hypothetical protein B4U79_17379 [Dinothrombium tinctorium]|uniref:Ig-like domain-containing protein n=1 Tax=Dinothrombium tinctorium TaxID=1965070 RepID=A0A3S3Q3D0_9ACAR|nr:hypothetical protein B4U79_17379 [Dinothrombium tinctorium]
MKWTHNEIDIYFPSAKYDLSADQQKLTIKNITLNEIGDYQCEVESNFSESMMKRFHVMTLMEPLSIIFVADRTEYDIKVSCMFHGSPKPNFKLVENELLPLNISSERKIKKVGWLINIFYQIDAIVEKKNATYSCQVSNKAGNHTSFLKVIESNPPKPRITPGQSDYSLRIHISPKKKENFEVAFLSPLSDYKLLIQKVDFDANRTFVNVSDVNELVFPIEEGLDFDYDYADIQMNLLNLSLNSMYNVKAAVANTFGSSEYSDWYTYLTKHVCGNDVKKLFDHVNLVSHETYDGEFNFHPENYECISRISTFANDSICAPYDQLNLVEVYDDIDENAPIILRKSTNSQWICSKNERIRIVYDSHKKSLGFSIHFERKSKISDF